MCNFLSSVSQQQKFEGTDGPELQLSFIGKQWKKYPIGVRVGRHKRQEKRNPKLNFGSSFYVSSPPPSLPCVNWAGQKSCLFYLRSSLQSLDLPLFYFCWLFLSLSFSHCHFGLFSPNYLTLGKGKYLKCFVSLSV